MPPRRNLVEGRRDWGWVEVMSGKHLGDCKGTFLELLGLLKEEPGYDVEAVAACQKRLRECQEALMRFLEGPLCERVSRLFGEDLAAEAVQEVWFAILTWERADPARYLRFLKSACLRNPLAYVTRFAIYCAGRIARDRGREAENAKTYASERCALLESRALGRKDEVLKAAIRGEVIRAVVDAAFAVAIDGILTKKNKELVARAFASFLFARIGGLSIRDVAALLGVSRWTAYNDAADYFALVRHQVVEARLEAIDARRADRDPA